MSNFTLGDRLTKYRAAAAFLYVPFLLTLGCWAAGTTMRDEFPSWVIRFFYWVGLLLLTVALAMDSYEVYAGKRRVKRLIEKRQQKTIDDRP